MSQNIKNLVQKSLKKRKSKELRFRLLGITSIGLALSFLLLLFVMLTSKGYGAFLHSKIKLELDLTKEVIAENSDMTNEEIANISNSDLIDKINYRRLIKKSLREKYPDAQSIADINSLYQLTSKIASLELKEIIVKNPNLIGQKSELWLSTSSKVDIYFKHHQTSSLNEKQIEWIDKTITQQEIKTAFNWQFFQFADSREPEIAGIGAGLVGSIFVMLIFLSFAFPVGVMCAFYLEEFAPKNRITDIIEISINNLAAIPSIIYGLLGLTVYLQFFHLPRSSSLVGGMTLFMLVLPVIIIATRNTIRSIPNTIRDAAIGLGASKVQIVLHHLLPLSIPGIMTGTILAISRALGETAPLLMIGMIAFIADIPQSFLDPTTVLPVQIYLWSDSPEVGFAEKTSAAILVLLTMLILFNLIAVILRKKFEKKW
ncbi:MAG: phosphate ABC transporter permease PstA [Pelagibacterales bacterium]|nr:phosphate ABC transporter permease PstA [Pelagibacterales bacterium]